MVAFAAPELSPRAQVMINDEKHLVILPLVDWLNHHSALPPSPPPVTFDRETSQFNVRAVEGYAKGAHVWITYGTKGGSELLVSLSPPEAETRGNTELLVSLESPSS